MVARKETAMNRGKGRAQGKAKKRAVKSSGSKDLTPRKTVRAGASPQLRQQGGQGFRLAGNHNETLVQDR
jgi:hypothetical protein